MKVFTLFALILCLGISNVFGEVHPGLKVKGDFRGMQLVVEDIGPNKLLTREDIVNTVKLRLFSNNIKTKEVGSEFLYVKVKVMELDDGVNYVFDVGIELIKRSYAYEVSKSVAGITFTPRQGAYGALGICYTKDRLLSSVKGSIDRFLVDYLESNMAD